VNDTNSCSKLKKGIHTFLIGSRFLFHFLRFDKNVVCHTDECTVYTFLEKFNKWRTNPSQAQVTDLKVIIYTILSASTQSLTSVS
jgi:hypothetical protein